MILINLYCYYLSSRTVRISSRCLEKNKHICTKGKYIYILKAKLDDYIDKDKPDILKIGKTMKYKIRISTYNTSVKDNVIVLYRAKVNDISAVENCLSLVSTSQCE